MSKAKITQQWLDLLTLTPSLLSGLGRSPVVFAAVGSHGRDQRWYQLLQLRPSLGLADDRGWEPGRSTRSTYCSGIVSLDTRLPPHGTRTGYLFGTASDKTWGGG